MHPPGEITGSAAPIETDAIVVAISEETGSISYAYKGILVRGVTAEELRAFLTSILVKPEKSRRPLEWLRHSPAM